MEVTPFSPNQRSDINMRGSEKLIPNSLDGIHGTPLGETIPVKMKVGTNIASMRKTAQSQIDDLLRSKRKCEYNMYIIDIIRMVTWVTTLLLCGWILAAYDGDMMVYAVKHFHNGQCIIMKNPESAFAGVSDMTNRTRRTPILPMFGSSVKPPSGSVGYILINITTPRTPVSKVSDSPNSRKKRSSSSSEDAPRNIFTRTTYRDLVAKIAENFPLITVLEIIVSICGFLSKKNARRKLKDVGRKIKERQAIVSYGGSKDKRIEHMSRVFRDLLDEGSF